MGTKKKNIILDICFFVYLIFICDIAAKWFVRITDTCTDINLYEQDYLNERANGQLLISRDL